MASLWAAQQMIVLGTSESRKCSINTSRNLLLWADCIYYEFYYYVLTPSEFVLVPLGIGDKIWKYFHLVLWASTGVSASQHHQPSGCNVPVSGESRGIWQNLPTITWQSRTLVQEHLMARQLPFHTLTSPITKGCPWWMLMWSYVGANWTSKLGDTSPEQGCLDMSISAPNTTLQSKGVMNRDTSAPYQQVC